MKTEKEEMMFESTVHFQTHPKVYIDTLKVADATPSVKGRTVLKSPASATTVTNFTGGVDGQTIKILGNGNLTVTNGTPIKTNTGANKVLASNKIYTFTLIIDHSVVPNTGVWYENS